MSALPLEEENTSKRTRLGASGAGVTATGFAGTTVVCGSGTPVLEVWGPDAVGRDRVGLGVGLGPTGLGETVGVRLVVGLGRFETSAATPKPMSTTRTTAGIAAYHHLKPPPPPEPAPAPAPGPGKGPVPGGGPPGGAPPVRHGSAAGPVHGLGPWPGAPGRGENPLPADPAPWPGAPPGGLPG